MNLLEIVRRRPILQPWTEGEKIPWHEPAFSKRMLEEHLSQQHDLASRRFDRVDHHVSWIDREILSHRPSRVLDLGCGPGLYTERLSRLGLCLRESSWEPNGKTATERYLIVDAHTGVATRHGATIQAYSDAEYRSLLLDCGFARIDLLPSLTGKAEDAESHFFVILAGDRSGNEA